jgi:hypothetical protein
MTHTHTKTKYKNCKWNKNNCPIKFGRVHFFKKKYYFILHIFTAMSINIEIAQKALEYTQESFTIKDVKCAFQKQVRKMHTDKGGDGDINFLIQCRDFLLAKISWQQKRCEITSCKESPISNGLCDFHLHYAKT